MDDQYNLRDRGGLKRPIRYRDDSGTGEGNLKKLQSECKAKERSIFKRMNKIREIISCRGSRTKISFLRKQLEKIFEETKDLHLELMNADIEPCGEETIGIDWIEDLRIHVEECTCDVEEYLRERVDDAPSLAMTEGGSSSSSSTNESYVRSLKSFSELTYQKVEGWRQKKTDIGTITENLDLLHISNNVYNPASSAIYTSLPMESANQTTDTTKVGVSDMEAEGSKELAASGIDNQQHLIQQIPNTHCESEFLELPLRLAPEVSSVCNNSLVQSFGIQESSLEKSGVKLKNITNCKDNRAHSKSVSFSMHPEDLRPTPGFHWKPTQLELEEPMCQLNQHQPEVEHVEESELRGKHRRSEWQEHCTRFEQSRMHRTQLEQYQIDLDQEGKLEFERLQLQSQQQRKQQQEQNEQQQRQQVLLQQQQFELQQKEILLQKLRLQAQQQQVQNESQATQQHQYPPRLQLPANLNPLQNPSVDDWIDCLPGYENQGQQNDLSSSLALGRWIMNQHLPNITIPQFNGNALKWVEFVTHFKEMVHEQPCLSVAQRMAYLIQYTEGEAKRAISGFSNNWEGYCTALKRLKLMFGNKVRVAQAYLNKLLKGKAAKDDDIGAITDLYYNISDCLSNLQRLNYSSDLRSMEVLYQVLKLLPPKLLGRWREYSYKIQRTSEPSLLHLEVWLQERLMAMKDPFTPPTCGTSLSRGCTGREIPSYNTYISQNCMKCKREHHLSKCSEFLAMDNSKRFGFSQAEKLCFNCLKPGHVSSKCKSHHCYEEGCTGRHHTTLHKFFTQRAMPKEGDTNDNNKANKSTSENSSKESDSKFNATIWKSKAKRIFLLVVPVTIVLPGRKEVNTYAFLDDGSEGTFIRNDFARKIGLKGKTEGITISTILSTGQTFNTESVSFEVKGLHEKAKSHRIEDAITLPKKFFKVRSQLLPPELDSSYTYQHLQGLGLRDVSKEEITLLIGVDNFELTLIKEVREGKQGHPIAVRTELGWSAFGYVDSTCVLCPAQVNHLKIENMVESLWKTESFGSEFNSTKQTSIEDRELLLRMKSTSSLVDSRLEVGMLWNGKFGHMPDNYRIAEKRFRSLQSKLRRDPDLHDKYRANIQEYVAKGYARKMLPSEVKNVGPKTWYLPHHPVFNINKPDKIRIVMDAAAKKDGVCLNDYLHTGPDLTNNLIGVLLRFRNHPIAIVADIASMFHQVRVKQEDKDALRFLWTDDVNSIGPPDVYQMLVHIFGAKDSPCCAGFALRKTAIDNQHRYSSLAVKTVLRDFYVDDLLKSVESDIEAQNLIKELKEMLASSGFNLTKLFSNSQSALSAVASCDLGRNKETMELEKSPIERTLGILWDIKYDKFTFSSKPPGKTIPNTKRSVLKTVSSVFDPLGFLAPFLVRAKIILQDLWRRKCNWDDKLSKSEADSWKNWLTELQNVELFKIRRCYTIYTGVHRIELHIFVDASENAFGAVAYLRVMYYNGKVTISFVMAKSRLVPIKPLTIPRLDLQAVVLGVRLKNSIVDEIDIEINEITFWTDSMHVLQYIQNERRRFLVFVTNRVAEIREHSNANQWRHVPGKENPADDITRGLHIRDLSEPCRWLNGPDYLLMQQSCWPSTQPIPDLSNEDVELKVSTTSLIKPETSLVEQFKVYSSWQKLLDVVSWILRFISNARSKENKLHGYLTVPELKASMKAIIKLSQAESFSQELQQLKTKGQVSTSSQLLQLQPFVSEEGIILVGGRLRKADISMDAQHPIILHGCSWISKLLVTHEHRLNCRDGIESLVANIRQRFWIIGVRMLTKRVIKNCLDCKRRNAKPQVPIMADLPSFRVRKGCPVFYYSGVDFFGPIPVKFRRGTTKRWGSIFTCLSTRAVHLEVAEGLDTDSFINTLRRFVNRRGHPKMITSDCGSNFKGASKELKAALMELDQTKIGSNAAEQEIEWKFNPPDAPHMGGAWERLIRSIKRPLYAMLNNQTVTDFQLLTIFTEVESIVNSRPLTPTSDDVNDYSALTPNHFLLGRSNKNLPISDNFETNITSRKRWRQVQSLTNHFWTRWQKEYLPTLTIRPKWNKEQRNMQVGDLVQIIDNNIPRGMWNLARVNKVYEGDDNRVRVVEVKSSSGTYVRPVTKLCLLEEADG